MNDFESTFGPCLIPIAEPTEHEPKCKICNVDIPCIHQTDLMRLEGWNDYGRDIQYRMEDYARYLHDEDFEKFQPTTYIEPKNPTNPEWCKARLVACFEELRSLWISGRLIPYMGPEWNAYSDKWWKIENEITMLEAILNLPRSYPDSRQWSNSK